MSAPSNCIKENWGTFIAKPLVFSHNSSSILGRGLFNIAFAAKSIRFTPTYLETKGIDLDARILASITKTSSFLTKN
jgi:hypothetical protein